MKSVGVCRGVNWVQHEVRCTVQATRNVLNALRVLNALLNHINVARIKFLTVWWWQPLFLSGGRGASSVDVLLGDGVSLRFPLSQGSAGTDWQ